MKVSEEHLDYKTGAYYYTTFFEVSEREKLTIQEYQKLQDMFEVEYQKIITERIKS